MCHLRVCLFGKFRVQYDQQALTGFDSGRVQQLLSYLLLHRDRPHSRETLAGLLWNGDKIDQPSRSLRKAVWQLRSALDSQTKSLSDRVLLIEPDWIQIHPQAPLWLDVRVFEQAFDRVRGIQGRNLGTQEILALRSAVDLYQGGLQESWYQDWYLYERERLQHIYLVMLDKLMDHSEAEGQYEAGLTYGALVLRCERSHERTHRRLMRLHFLAGDRTAALRQYERCVAALAQELGVRPARQTVLLRQQIQADRFAPAAAPPVRTTGASDPAASAIPKTLDYLKQLQTVLSEVQRQVDQSVQEAERTLRG